MTISVIMPCFQQVRFLEEALRSVLDQTGVDDELIIMDPGSTDGSRELLYTLIIRSSMESAWFCISLPMKVSPMP